MQIVWNQLRLKNGVSILLLVCIVFSGCAQYKRPTLMIKVPDFYDNKTKINQLYLVADPYFSASKNQYIFNANLLDKGFLAIHFIAFNYGEQTYDLSKAKFVLVKDGVQLKPMEPAEVSRKVLKHTSLRMIGWGFAGLIILSVPFSIAAGIDSFRANKKIREAVAKDVLNVFQIGPHEAVDGFYFFQIGRNSNETEQALQSKYQLKIEKLRDVILDRNYEFQIGLN